MNGPRASRLRFWAKVSVAIGVDAALVSPLIVWSAVRGQSPEWALALHGRAHQRMLAWLFSEQWNRPANSTE